MREYFYMLGGMDYMLNEKSYHEPRRNREEQDVRDESSKHRTVSPVRAVLIAVINLVTR